jgi:hypothetical protein
LTVGKTFVKIAVSINPTNRLFDAITAFVTRILRNTISVLDLGYAITSGIALIWVTNAISTADRLVYVRTNAWLLRIFFTFTFIGHLNFWAARPTFIFIRFAIFSTYRPDNSWAIAINNSLRSTSPSIGDANPSAVSHARVSVSHIIRSANRSEKRFTITKILLNTHSGMKNRNSATFGDAEICVVDLVFTTNRFVVHVILAFLLVSANSSIYNASIALMGEALV